MSRPSNSSFFNRRTVLTGLAGAGLNGLPGIRKLAAAQQLRWGSAAIGSSGYVIIEALVNTANKHTDLKNSAMATAGGGENPALIGAGQLDLGQTNTADYIRAWNGAPPYPDKIRAHQMFGYAQFSVPLVVRADSAIRSLSDLKGKRIAVGPSGGAPAGTWRAVFKGSGMEKDVQMEFVGWRDALNGVQTGAVDAAVAIVQDGRPVAIVTQLEQAQKIRIVQLSDAEIEGARKENPGIVNAKLTPDLWPAVQSEVNAPGFVNMLIARSDLGKDVGYKIAKAIYDNAEAVRKIDKRLANIDASYALKFLLPDMPVNPGVAAYFREKRAWRSDLTVGD